MNKLISILSYFKYNQKNTTPFAYRNISNILVFTDSESEFLFIEKIAKTKKLLYSNDLSIPMGNNCTLLHPSDFNWYGKCKNQEINNILNKKYDLFIDYIKEYDNFTNYIYSLIQANCKVSYRMEDWVDIHIPIEKNDVVKYTNNIIQTLQKFN